MKSKAIPFVISLLIIGAVIGFIAYKVATDVQMPFPREPHGTFIEAPHRESVDDKEKITWILPEGGCASVGYEVQEVGYTPENGKLWGGMGAECTLQEKGSVCVADLHPDMIDRDSQWNIQAVGYDCERGGNYVSELVMIE
ncbi:MAG: hypothetical protein RL141_253 [Candidatus Parcubacteria bacterium]|jgi:hypothetical protein